MDSRFTHIYWGLGSNFSPLGNLRVGIGPVEVGIVQGTGVGAVYVHRTPGPLFLQLGVLSTSGGGGIIGGGGLEWKASSFFRFRTDITVSTDISYQTQGYVSVGGVLVL